MTVKFYLKTPGKQKAKGEEKAPEKEVSVFARICYKGVAPFKYSSFKLAKIKPSQWNKKAQKARAPLKTAPEFNARLTDIENRIKKVHLRYVSENDDVPTVAIFKNLLDREFNKNPETTQQEKDLKTFWATSINSSSDAKQGHGHTCAPASPFPREPSTTWKFYTCILKTLRAGQKIPC
jgi:hypothetical protein